MPALTTKNIPDNLYDALKDIFRQNRRSINSEAIFCLERALLPRQAPPEESGLARLKDYAPLSLMAPSPWTRSASIQRDKTP
uniref:Arc-like DNA binding domain-containing protein n=1 Tax=Candidatus Kentrum sp. FW TaxID=2126338 RepID=A0A450SHD8_9GAMM|nr:MAG: hypothetical protein BECKFW1821A_GA0114235_103711 [Candidatus Kentron sp. FW]